MKKLLIVLVFGLFSCSADKSEETPPQPKSCYNILTRGYDDRGDYIIIKYANFVQKRYSVTNYQDYIGQSQLCEPITLTEQNL